MDSNIINLTKKQQDTPNLSEDFQTYLVIKDKGFNVNMPCNLHFFEWSDVNQELTFDDHDKFIRWLSSTCRIYSKWDEDKKIKYLAHTETGVWIICREGTHELIIEDSFDNMKKAFETKKPTTVSAVTPHSYNPPRQSPVYGEYPHYARCCYGEDYWDDYYD